MIFSRLKDYLKGRKIKIKLGWFGEKGLGKPMPKNKPVTDEEIYEMLHKGGSKK